MFSLQFYNTWATIENATTSPLPLKPCLYYAAVKSQLKDTQNPFVRTITESDPKYKHTSTQCQVLHKYGETVDFLQVQVILPLDFGQREMLDQLQTLFSLKQLKLKAKPAIKHQTSTHRMLRYTKWMLMLRCVLWTWNKRLLFETLCLNLF